MKYVYPRYMAMYAYPFRVKSTELGFYNILSRSINSIEVNSVEDGSFLKEQQNTAKEYE